LEKQSTARSFLDPSLKLPLDYAFNNVTANFRPTSIVYNAGIVVRGTRVFSVFRIFSSNLQNVLPKVLDCRTPGVVARKNYKQI